MKKKKKKKKNVTKTNKFIKSKKSTHSHTYLTAIANTIAFTQVIKTQKNAIYLLFSLITQRGSKDASTHPKTSYVW
jgi:intergrase/recombinase